MSYYYGTIFDFPLRVIILYDALFNNKLWLIIFFSSDFIIVVISPFLQFCFNLKS
jgi:hypothetical protein